MLNAARHVSRQHFVNGDREARLENEQIQRAAFIPLMVRRAGTEATIVSSTFAMQQVPKSAKAWSALVTNNVVIAANGDPIGADLRPSSVIAR